VATLLMGGPVLAHTAMVDSTPAQGARLDVAPTSLRFEFNENIGSRPQVALMAPDGSQVAVSNVKAVGRTVTADVAGADQRGTYAASYRVLSADGHPVTATITFDVTTGKSVEQVATKPRDASFVHRHKNHLLWGAGAAMIAIGLLLAPLRKRS
jgi:methionine-rich copper-binding protein CopC